MSVKGMIVMMTFSVMVWKSLELKWTTETLYTACCEGQDKILRWNYSLENNETVQSIQWFFNKSTQIAYESESSGFHVSPLYKGRVEWNGKMGILLKTVSSVDTGEYTLYLNLATEQTENMQTIFFAVYESPTYKCKPSITIHSENVIFCSTNSCGGIHLSTEWRISGKLSPVGNESYLKINSSWNAELVFCCLHRPNMQCRNGDSFDFCASTTVFFPEDKHAPDCKYTENTVNLTPAVVVLTTTNFLSIVVFCFCYRKKIRKLCEQQNSNPEEQDNEFEAVQIMLPGEQQNANPEEQDNEFEAVQIMLPDDQQNSNPEEQDNESETFQSMLPDHHQNSNPKGQDNENEIFQSMLPDDHQNSNPKGQDNESETFQSMLPDDHQNSNLKEQEDDFETCQSMVPDGHENSNAEEQDNEFEIFQSMLPDNFAGHL